MLVNDDDPLVFARTLFDVNPAREAYVRPGFCSKGNSIHGGSQHLLSSCDAVQQWAAHLDVCVDPLVDVAAAAKVNDLDHTAVWLLQEDVLGLGRTEHRQCVLMCCRV